MDKTGGESQDFPSNFFLSHSAEKHRRGTLPCCCFSKFMVARSSRIRRGGDYQDFLRKIFSLSAEKGRRGTP